MIGQRRAKVEYGLSDDDLATLTPCSQRDGGLYDEADLTRVRDANPECQARLAESKRKEEERQLAICQEVRRWNEAYERENREFWQPLRRNRTPAQLYTDPLPEEFVAMCRESVAEHHKLLGGRCDKREVVCELLDRYLFGGVAAHDDWEEAKDAYYILGVEDHLIDGILSGLVAI